MLCHVSVAGTPYEMGWQHGRQAGHLVQKAMDFYNRYTPHNEAEVRREARRIEATLRSYCPNTLAEMKGIAAGSGLPYEDILLLNVHYEVQAKTHQRCTVIGLPRTPDGPLIGKTDDVVQDERELETFFRVQPEAGYACIYYAIAGTLWAVGGVNEAGLAQAMTGLVPGRAQSANGIPSCILLRLVLEQCGTAEEAVALSESKPLLWWGHTLTVADASSDEVVVIEDYPTTVGIRRSRDEPLVQTNHCLVPDTNSLAAPREDQDILFAGLWENSHNRYENAARLAQEMPHSVEGLKGLLY